MKTQTRRLLISSTLLLLLLALLVGCGQEDDSAVAAGGLEGELITFTVGTSPGGGFDSYTRLVAPFLAEELGADHTVQNLTGAGGLLALNTVWTEKPDGTSVAMMNGPGTIGSVLGGSEGIEFELAEFTYLGRIAGEPRVFAVNANVPVDSAEALMEYQDGFRFSATGPGGSTYNDAALAIELMGLAKGEIVAGFDGSEEAILSVSAGEVEGIISTLDTILPHIESGDLKPLAVVGSERVEELPDTPTLGELPLGEEGKKAAKAMVAITEAGRIFIAPPGMDEALVAEMRQALQDVVDNPEFQEEAERQGRPISFLGGEKTLGLVNDALEAPEIVREILKEALSSE